jgi:Xaa-Pro aminopeptidase
VRSAKPWSSADMGALLLLGWAKSGSGFLEHSAAVSGSKVAKNIGGNLSTMQSIDARTFRSRIERLGARLADDGVAGALVGPTSDLFYFCGYRAMPLERLTALVVAPDATSVLVVPTLERPRVGSVTSSVVDVVVWDDIDDPYDVVCRLISELCERASENGDLSLAIDPRIWAVHLLEIQSRLRGAAFVDLARFSGPQRAVKDELELDAMRRAAAVADRVACRLGELVEAGLTERQVAKRIGDALLDEGAETVEFVIVASGPNSASPHHEPSHRVLSRGDVVVCDFGGTVDGYCSDITRTVVLGEVPTGFGRVYEVVEEAQQAAVEKARAGTSAAAVDRAARSVIEDAGYGENFLHRTGHGIGIDVHEAPYIVSSNREKLSENMTFSIEPGIYVEGRWGARIEDIVVSTPLGGERLNDAPRDLLVI